MICAIRNDTTFSEMSNFLPLVYPCFAAAGRKWAPETPDNEVITKKLVRLNTLIFFIAL